MSEWSDYHDGVHERIEEALERLSTRKDHGHYEWKVMAAYVPDDPKGLGEPVFAAWVGLGWEIVSLTPFQHATAGDYPAIYPESTKVIGVLRRAKA